MVIGIIGAGISGLAAGRILARAGHEVTVFEKSNGLGGRVSTRYAGNQLQSKMDHGLPMFTVTSPEFRDFTNEILEKNLIRHWGRSISVYDGSGTYEKNPNPLDQITYTSVDGMNRIGQYLSRWVDVRKNSKVGGLTHYGGKSKNQRPWIINFTSSETFRADAVIIALPAPQAYGILAMTIDETSTLKIVREIDQVHYRPSYSLMVGYGDKTQPGWDGVICKSPVLEFVSNEASKRTNQETSFVLHANEQFSRHHLKSDKESITKLMLTEFAEIEGGWVTTPEWNQLHLWRFSRPKSVLNRPYFELETNGAPLALVGDYYEGDTVDAAYRSGVLLAKSWLDKLN